MNYNFMYSIYYSTSIHYSPCSLFIITITLDCCRITRLLHVPNTTDKRVDFTVESDFSPDMTSGDSKVSVLSRQSTEYKWRLRARRRGHFRGVLAFVAKPDNTPLVRGEWDGKALYTSKHCL